MVSVNSHVEINARSENKDSSVTSPGEPSASTCTAAGISRTEPANNEGVKSGARRASLDFLCIKTLVKH